MEEDRKIKKTLEAVAEPGAAVATTDLSLANLLKTAVFVPFLSFLCQC